MVGGAGYMAGKSAARGSAREAEQEERLAGLESQQAPPPQQAPPAAAPAGGDDSKLEQLQKLGQLRDSGVLTAEEFEAEKQRILAS
jgi:hypothetical protein